MNVSLLLARLKDLDINLRLERDQLIINAPKGVITPDLQAEITAGKQQIIAYLRDEEAVSAGALQPVKVYPHEGPIPLSFGQQRLWFLEKINPDDTAYNLWETGIVPTLLDKDILDRCLTEIVRRHDTLRASFHLENGQPFQVIIPPMPIAVETIDISGLSGLEKDQGFRRIIVEKTNLPIDLSQPPLFRTFLIVLGPEESVFFIVMHHIISDGTSIKLFFRELRELYDAAVTGHPPRLPALPVQYTDFIYWQKELLQGNRLDQQISYWKKKLAGPLNRLALPMDHPWPLVENPKAGVRTGSLSAASDKRLLKLAQTEGVTLFTLLLAAFKTLLARITGQNDIIVGTPVWGRTRPELEPLIGLFLNTLVLRTDLSGDLYFGDALKRVKETILDAFANQDLPFEQLVEVINPERKLNRNPIFDILVNFLPETASDDGPPAAGFQMIDISDREAKFPITLYIDKNGDRLQFRLMYQKALFTERRMACLLDQYLGLLEQICVQPDLDIGLYSLVTPETSTVLPDPTAALDVPTQVPLPDLILAWAEKAPGQPAICQESCHWTYKDLEHASRTAAGALQEMGCARGDVVALSGQKCPGLVAAMLAVLRAGGVLLTIDPSLPPQRQKVMLQEARAGWFIQVGESLNQENDPADELQLRRLNLDPFTGDPQSLSSSHEIFLPNLREEDPAYIFFTSGTTSTPKGVSGTHRGLSHFIQWQSRTFQIKPDDRAAQLTQLSFDVILRDVFTPLASGSCLYIPSPETASMPERLLKWMRAEKITLIHTVPAIVQNWLAEAPNVEPLDDLRWVFFAGEPLTDSLVGHCRARFFPKSGIINLYGPTETTLAKFFYCVPAAPLPGVQPVGSPLPETQALILNTRQKLCGIGERGEIYIRTPFRSAGYINNPEEQQLRFLLNPLAPGEAHSDDIVYRSGDIGRYRPDGLIEILGREDDQVKINGVRVELGEVTGALLEHPAIQSGVVVSRKEPAGQPYLVAYVVAQKPADLPPADLRQYMAERLPISLVPSRFVFLDHLPLNPNGKVDRTMLPDPAAQEQGTDRAYPRDVVEARLVQIWKRLLHTDHVDVKDDFFILGGHSLMAVRMFVQIQEVFGVNLPLTSLFREATIEHLARLIHQQSGAQTWSSLTEIQPKGDQLPLFCVHGLTGDVFWFGRMVPFMNPNRPIFGMQSRGLDGISQPLDSIREIAANYIREMQTIQPEGPYFICGYSFGGSVAYEMACQLEQQGQKLALLAIIDHATPRSGYYMVKLNFRFFTSFFLNIPYRLADFFLLRPDQIAARLGRKLRVLIKAFRSRRPSDQSHNQQVTASDLIDEAPNLAPAVRKVIETNYRAIRAYEPGFYNGTLTLLRARGGRLLVSHDPQMGWGKFARTVNIRMISGSHLGLFKGTNIQDLAKELQHCLDDIESERNN